MVNSITVKAILLTNCFKFVLHDLPVYLTRIKLAIRNSTLRRGRIKTSGTISNWELAIDSLYIQLTKTIKTKNLKFKFKNTKCQAPAPTCKINRILTLWRNKRRHKIKYTFPRSAKKKRKVKQSSSNITILLNPTTFRQQTSKAQYTRLFFFVVYG